MDKQLVKRGRGPPEGHCLSEGGHQGNAKKLVLGAVLFRTPMPGLGQGQAVGRWLRRGALHCRGHQSWAPAGQSCPASWEKQLGQGGALGFKDGHAHQDEDPDFTSKTWVLSQLFLPRHGALGCDGQLGHSRTCNGTEEEEQGMGQRAPLQHCIKSMLYTHPECRVLVPNSVQT